MALPKILIRSLKPYVILLTGGMLYLAIIQLKQVETTAQNQSASNIRIASSIIRSNIEATFGKLYVLETKLRSENSPTNTQTAARGHHQQSFDELVDNLLKRTPNFADIVRYQPKDRHYDSIIDEPLSQKQLNAITWKRVDTVADSFYISSIYQKNNGRWVFALKHAIEDLSEEIWIEFDLLHTTQGLRDLKTLDSGYVFVVDQSSERLVFHPDPSRIGTKSISYHAGISHQISQGEKIGEHEYYYQDNFKLSVFNADNSLNWVFISGTDRQDILTSSYQFALTGIVISSLLLLWIVVSYLMYRLNSSLSELNQKNDLASFKQQLKAILNQFTFHSGVQFCLYNSEDHSFSTIDYHGNKSIVHCDQILADSFSHGILTYKNAKYSDALARKLKISRRHYCIPLRTREQLTAVIYIQSSLPIHRSILRMVKDYTEVSLSNLLLHHQLSSKDLMTQLDNKHTFNAALQQYQGQTDTYIANIDIDNFDHLNRAYGDAIGDRMIKVTADAIRQQFPKPKGISLARLGGKEFGILFKANDKQDAKTQLDQCRTTIATAVIAMPDINLSLGASIGFSLLQSDAEKAQYQAEHAKQVALRSGKNRVEAYTEKLSIAS